jgi:tubulin monoglycylase TTLL15
MYQAANNYNDTSVEGSLNQFFEMVRFDFIVDDQLNVYLMEANMSPNLSSRHFPPNRLLYEQVLNSYFSLVGLTQFARQHLSSTMLPVHYLDGRVELPKDSVKLGGGKYGLDELISEKELSVYEELCVSNECHMNCHKTDCKVCYFCLNNQDKLHLRRAIFEQYSRWNFKRLLPSTLDEDLQLQAQHPDRLSGAPPPDNQEELVNSNHIHVQWFRGKCFSDPRFCSY